MKPAVDLILLLAYMAGLYALSSLPGTPAPDSGPLLKPVAWTPPALQNLLHLPAYGILAWLWARMLEHAPMRRSAALALALTLTLAYGLFDEWHQSLVPGRYPSATDLLANTIGALVALGIYHRGRAAWGET